MTYKIDLPNGTIRVSDKDFVPFRKKPTLAIQKGNDIMKIASFNDMDCAEMFLDLFGRRSEE